MTLKIERRRVRKLKKESERQRRLLIKLINSERGEFQELDINYFETVLKSLLPEDRELVEAALDKMKNNFLKTKRGDTKNLEEKMGSKKLLEMRLFKL